MKRLFWRLNLRVNERLMGPLEWKVGGPPFGYEQMLRDITKSALRDLSIQYIDEILRVREI